MFVFTSYSKPSSANGLAANGLAASWLAALDEADQRGAPKTRRRTLRLLVHPGWGVAATATAGVGNGCNLSFREAPRLGRQARGKRAWATIALRHDER